MPDAPRRPTPVTLACLFVGFSAVLLVVNLMTVLGDWGSLDMQEGLQPVLDAEPLSGTGLTMDQLLGYLRIAAQVVVVLSIAAGVFAIYAARGHEPSRWILSIMLVLGGVTFASSSTAGILPGVLAFLCVVALWSRDARRWFALKNGRPVPPAARDKSGSAPVAHHPSQVGSAGPADGRVDPFGAGATAGGGQTVHGQPAAQQAPPAPGPDVTAQNVDPARRPRSVEVAVWVALGTSVAVAAVSGFVLLLVLAAGGVFRDALQEPGLMQDMLRGSGWTASGLLSFMRASFAVTTVLGMLGVAVAAWARTGSPSGHRALVLMSIATIVVSVIATFGFLPMNLLTLAAAIVVLVQLRKPASRAWFEARSGA